MERKTEPRPTPDDGAPVTALLDTTGATCPIPIMKLRRAVYGLRLGDVLEVRATDPGTADAVDRFCRTTGNALLESATEGDVFTFRIRKTR